MYKVSLSGDGVHMTSNAPHAVVKVPWNIMQYGVFISGRPLSAEECTENLLSPMCAPN